VYYEAVKAFGRKTAAGIMEAKAEAERKIKEKRDE